MSSTQHQLIEQCATRLRGIVEALDNIHDSTPHRWSTDLDDVHSSAESLLALIKDQAPTQAAQGLAGAALAQPSPAQAEAERPEVVGYRSKESGMVYEQDYGLKNPEALTTVAECERIVGALRADRDSWAEQAEQRLADWDEMRKERDAALANVDALAVQVLKLGGTISFAHHRTDQAGQVPQAWLDVQAERRRQITAEGWTPEHDDEHSHGQMARAAACYALAGSSDPNDGTAALLVSLAWPWDQQWWKPTSARRDLVKACALALAEIERLDRAGISQSPQPGATTASS
ncbi:TPA: hypothetical protein L5Q18_003262 [Pseudomonas aeruginosa]|uniref:hypothetical protein n=1 Tax=Pseudomonas aeruginosa TaxID=287 RepID=UPI0010687624|nr:hypothetical protein [Pseudomonas aeruginosa]TEC26007.1 hypothetical protein IPC1599_01075 [Pseudomonas aeruginosa]HBP0649261.1 hypothetical protein [Pseudomonas aeruginosa]